MRDFSQGSCASLEDEVQRLRGLLADANADLPAGWGFTTTEAAIFRVLLSNDYGTHAVIGEVAGVDGKAAARVHMHRIRRKVSASGIEIETVSGKGWRLVGREHWRRTLAARTTTEGVN